MLMEPTPDGPVPNDVIAGITIAQHADGRVQVNVSTGLSADAAEALLYRALKFVERNIGQMLLRSVLHERRVEITSTLPGRGPRVN